MNIATLLREIEAPTRYLDIILIAPKPRNPQQLMYIVDVMNEPSRRLVKAVELTELGGLRITLDPNHDRAKVARRIGKELSAALVKTYGKHEAIVIGSGAASVRIDRVMILHVRRDDDCGLPFGTINA
jgi:hypothetical protein